MQLWLVIRTILKDSKDDYIKKDSLLLYFKKAPVLARSHFVLLEFWPAAFEIVFVAVILVYFLEPRIFFESAELIVKNIC